MNSIDLEINYSRMYFPTVETVGYVCLGFE
jgi:hypothetical protein